MNVSTAAPVAITGVGAISRPAIGARELARAADLWRTEPTDHERPWAIAELDNFAPADFLGKRGWRFLPEATRAALAAVQLTLAHANEAADGATEHAPERVGVALGTNFAVDAVVDRIDRALLAEGIAGISPVECPNFSVNVPAGRLGIAHGLRAFNITLVNLLTAGLESALVGARAMAADRADAVLVGAVEGRPPAAARTVTGPGVDAAGACLLHLERPQRAAERGATVHALLTGGSRRTVPGNPAAAQRVLAAALDALGTPPGVLHLSLPATGGAHVAQAAEDWAKTRGAATALTVTTGAPQASATPVLGLAQHLVRGVRESAVVGAVGPRGNLTLLRVEPPRSRG
ncbi:beta-ketoacyl synthase N-terminal-like domain-containing protein [Streptomyces buecherae]|uniref:beta-ketoacyl synthase N-terminal-like domain-containing protein n=1 Tax=Streptomyces buecherae TaxID=2763006 RepID=UPI0033FB4163